MKEKNPFKINFAFLSGSVIVFILLMMPPFLQAFTVFNPQGEIELKAELKAQEINPWIDESISELNDLTLRQVFEQNNLIEYDEVRAVNGTYTIDNDLIYVVSSNSSSARLEWASNDFDMILDDLYYYNYSIIDIDFDSYIRMDGSFLPRNDYGSSLAGELIILSGLEYATMQFENFRLYHSTSVAEINDTVVYSNIYVTNLSILGITDITQEEMDIYYQRYLRYKDSTINDYTTVMNNTLQLAPFINPLELVSKSIEFYTEIVVDTYNTIRNVWQSANDFLTFEISERFVDIVGEDYLRDIRDSWWLKPFVDLLKGQEWDG